MRELIRFLCFLLAAAAAAQGAERDIVRTFAATPGVTVAIDTYRGGITITEGDQPEVRIAVHLEIGADTPADAERMLKGFDLEFSDAKGVVAVRARHPAEERARFVWRDGEQIEPTFRVTVPRECNLELKTLAGAIAVGNIYGRLTARAETGSVFFRKAAGSVDASIDHGDIVISQCIGSVRARVLRGVIRVGLVTGPCDLKNTTGDIEVLTAKSGIDAHAEAGTATIGLPRDFAGKARITTSGGNIVLKVDPAARCDFDVSTSLFGRIESQLPLTIDEGAVGQRKLVARLNGGGAPVVLHASGGYITLQPGRSLFE